MDGNASFGQWLKRRRKALRLTQGELARQASCAEVTIRKIEADERRPSEQIARRLADLLALAPADRAAFLRSARAELCADQLPAPAQIVRLPNPSRRFTNLPVPTTSLIGREKDVVAVAERLRRVDVRLLTLIGPPGIGKTRLGLQVASDLLDDFDDGCCFVALAPIRDPRLVATAIAQPLGVQERASQALAEHLKHYLQDKCMLLVLDNFEQVAAAALLVADLLTAAPHLKVLATSRAALRTSGEHEYVVPPLALPDLDQLAPPAALARYAGVDLFVQRTHAVAPGFALTSANAMAVAEICHRLDGLPLAIELAAARGKLLTPSALLSRLDHRLNLLTSGARDLPLRQQTLRNTIDWSYDLLDQSEQTLFRRLAVFVGGCTLEAAEAVTMLNVQTLERSNVLDELAALLDKSLLWQTEGTDGALRFGMLEIMREYALERLEEHGETEALRQRHAAYYLALVEGVEMQFQQTKQSMWLDQLKIEHDNLRAILTWGKTTAGGMEIGLRLAAALAPFWELHGHLSEGRAWLAAFLARGEKPCTATATRANALFGLGTMAREQNDYPVARAVFEESVMIARGLGDTPGVIRALLGLGRVTGDQGDYDAARAHIAECLATCRALGDQAGIASALQDLGMIAWWQGDYPAVRAAYEEVLAIAHNRQDEVGPTYALNKLGDVARIEGDYAQALMLYEAGLTLTRKLENKFGVLWTLHNLGELARDQGDYSRAAALYEESLALAREIEYTSGIASMLNRLGEVTQAQGEYARAGTLHRESLRVFRDLAQKRDALLCLEGLAWVAEAQEQAKRSAVLYGAVAALREMTGAQVPPLDRASYARSVDRVRLHLGEATFAEAWGEGHVMPLEQAINFALSDGM